MFSTFARTPGIVDADGLRAVVVHDIPGRVRFAMRSLKGNSAAAQAVCAQVVTLEGVASVRANLVTGGLVVEYHGAALTRGRIFAALCALGFDLDADRQGQAPANPSRSWDATVAGIIVKAIAHKLIEDAVYTALAVAI
jgi:hypothetical protein